jgi:hypothetical protein
MVTDYFVARMCVPRDMGCLAARAIRKIASKIQLQKNKEICRLEDL